MKHPLNIFLSLLLALTAMTGRRLSAAPVINEFMASNATTLADDDGAFPDWIEIFNPDSTPVDLNGWFLTDTATDKTKWKFPAISLPSGDFLVVFASNKNRRDPARPLHTNFALSSQGEYLGLVKPDQTTVVSEYAPIFPPQQTDHSYGLIAGTNGTPSVQAFLSKPTPGAANSPAASAGLPQTVGYSRAAGVFTESFKLQLNGALPDQRIRYVVVPATTAGAVVEEPTATSPAYATPIPISASVVVRAAVFSANDTVKGATITTYYAKLAANLASFASQLPVVVIDTLGSGPLAKGQPDQASWLTWFTPAVSGSSLLGEMPDLSGALTMSVRGSSSALFPKKSYNLGFTDGNGNSGEEALADLPGAERWALVGGWKYDLTHINNAFIYSLSNRMGGWAPQVRFAEVFLNTAGTEIAASDYAGIYAVTDRVEVGRNRVDLKSLDAGDLGPSQITGGYILKIDVAAPEDVSWQTTRGVGTGSSVILATPGADVARAQTDYIRDYVQRMEDALYSDRASGWAQRTYLGYLDRASWVDHHILNTFAANPDAFLKSAYFTKDRDAKLSAGPVWDFDRALGSYWDERSYRWDVWSGVGASDVWQTGWWGVIATDPEFMQAWIDRWQALRRAELSTSNLTSLVSSLSGQISPEAAARDAARWPDNQSPYGTYAAQIARMKGWLTARAQWIDEQFLSAPATATANNSITFTAPSAAKLAYTLDGSDPRALGGELAPNAIVASSPVSLPAGANIHIRSYRAELRGTFPGSPWSSAAVAEASTPLSPVSRIVNLSSRAVIGSGDNALFAGVVVADTDSKRYLARAIGPGLAAFGAEGTIGDPQLRIISSSGAELFRNTGWEAGPDASKMANYNKSVGAFPLVAGVKDSALAAVLPAGSNNLQISTPSNQTGIGLAEFYELDATGRTVNLSTRARVRTGDGALIGGFVVQGTAYKRLLIRAVGPTLSAFGLSDTLRDPVLAVYSGQTVVATNDRWDQADNPAAIAAAAIGVGAFALAAQSEDAAVLITLPPGAYTVEVKGKAGTEGIALLEIYEIP